jgi:hypothetical protein
MKGKSASASMAPLRVVRCEPSLQGALGSLKWQEIAEDGTNGANFDPSRVATEEDPVLTRPAPPRAVPFAPSRSGHVIGTAL